MPLVERVFNVKTRFKYLFDRLFCILLVILNLHNIIEAAGINLQIKCVFQYVYDLVNITSK